jgi:carbon starvation protein
VKNKPLQVLVWAAVSILGAAAFGVIALHRGETINAAWLVIAAVCTYSIGYRFYSKFLATKDFELNDRRATPAERLNNGLDFVPTGRFVLFGHHFAAIAGAGPLVGPVLAAQFGYLPGTIWLIIGVVFAGAVQDFIILFASMRRDGKSLGQMARDEINTVAGSMAMVAVLAIMIILLAVLALIVVNALRHSSWGLFTIACTIPIALLMGWWMNKLRPGKVTEATVIGLVLVLFAVVAGGWVANSPTWSAWFTASGPTLVWLLVGYGFLASVLPVWVLLAPCCGVQGEVGWRYALPHTGLTHYTYRIWTYQQCWQNYAGSGRRSRRQLSPWKGLRAAPANAGAVHPHGWQRLRGRLICLSSPSAGDVHRGARTAWSARNHNCSETLTAQANFQAASSLIG